MRIVVIGGTGHIGRRVVARLERLAQAVVVASPTTGVDSATGDGLTAALERADAVIDVSNSASTEGGAARAFFAAAAANLAVHERAAGVRHHVVLSIVGVDTASDGYLLAKAQQERAVRDGGVPHTILRTTQFFEFARQIADWNTVEDTVHLPPTNVQPVASDDVAAALVRLVMTGSPAGTVEMGGPEQMTLPDFVRRVLLSDHDDRYVVDDATAVPVGFNIGGRLLVPGPSGIRADTSLGDWLDRAPATTR